MPSWSSKSRQKTSDLAGDGTTTATVLARCHLTKRDLRNISIAGSQSHRLLSAVGIDKAVAGGIVTSSTKSGKPVEGQGRSRQRRRDQSANNDQRPSAICLPTLSSVSAKTVSSPSRKERRGATDSQSTSTACSSTRATSRRTSSPTCPGTMEANLRKLPWSCCMKRKSRNIRDLVPLLEKVGSNRSNRLLIIAEDVDAEALTVAGRQQAPRHILNVTCRQSSRVRGSSQGDAG